MGSWFEEAAAFQCASHPNWRAMTNHSNVSDVVLGRDEQVEVADDGVTVVLTWSQIRGSTGIEMAQFSADEDLLSIFPKAASGESFVEQFSQVRELQIDTTNWAWNAASPVGENNRSGQLELSGLPKGFGTIFEYGLGIRRNYRGLIHAIEEKTDCTVIRFGAQGDEGAKGDVFHISLVRFSQYVREIELTKGRGATVVGRINDAVAHNEIADITGDAKVQPILGRLGQIQAMTRAISDDTPLDACEQSALVARMDAESKQIATEQPQSFGKLREELELVTLEVLIENFEKNLKGKAASSEPAWQQFFRDNTFALKQIFASPVAFYGEQLHLRHPDMHGAGGQIADFVLANTLTRSMVVVEIKTPATALIVKTAYRGKSSAEVYPPDKELSGAIAQLQAQMESARTDFDDIVGRTSSAEPIDTKVVRGAVIAGRLDALEQLRKDSFVRYRNGLHGIEVITFDEVLDRLIALQTMLKDSQD